MVIVYHNDGTKTVHNRIRNSRMANDDNIPYHEKMLRSYYDLECSHKLAPGTNKNWIKRTWERDGQRTAAGLD